MTNNEQDTRSGGPGALSPGLSELLESTLGGLVGTSRQQLAETRVTGSSGGGVVTVSLTGEGRLVGITILPEVLDDGVEALEDLILAASADAFEQVQRAKSDAVGSALGSLGLS